MMPIVLWSCDITSNIKHDNGTIQSPEQIFIGEYTDPIDGSTLKIGKVSDGALTFTATDAAGSPIKGKITLDGDTATLVFTESTWGDLPDGTIFLFKRDTPTMIQERTSLIGKTYSGVETAEKTLILQSIIDYKNLIKTKINRI